MKQILLLLAVVLVVSLTPATYAEDTQQDFDATKIQVNQLQAPDPQLPTGVAQPKGRIGDILSKMFSSGNGKIGARYLSIVGADGTINPIFISGATITGVNATTFGGQSPSYYLNANNITTGTFSGSLIPNATTTSAGKIQLAGDIGGTWNSVTINGNAITSAKILDATIANADISATAAIAGTKINPNFGAQDINGNLDLYLRNSTGSEGFHFHSRSNAGFDFLQISPRVGGATIWSQGITMLRSNGFIGMGDNTPTQQLDVTGNIRASGDIMANRICTSGGTGCVNLPLTATSIDGGGTANYVARFTDGNTLGTGSIVDTGTSVGIGTNSPTAKLDINGDVRLGNETFIGPSGANQGLISFSPDIGGGEPGIILQGDTGKGVLIRGNNGASVGMIVKVNGNVGIGASAPVEKLDVRGGVNIDDSANYDVWIQGGSTSAGGNGRNLAMLGVKTTDELRINYLGEYAGGVTINGSKTIIDGNVGIGTSSPTQKLEVSGKILVDDTTLTGALYLGERIDINRENSNTSIPMMVFSRNNSNTSVNNAQIGTIGDGAGNVSNIYISKGGTADMFNLNLGTGNIGIGTTTPTQKLDVVGKIRMSTQTSTGDTDDIVATKGYVDAGLLGPIRLEGTNLISKTVNMNDPALMFYTDNTGNNFLGYRSGINNTTGKNNFFTGYKSGEANTTGYWNAFIGPEAGMSNTTGFRNFFVGNKSGYNNTIGDRNIFIGSDGAGQNNTSGSSNQFIGNGAGWSNTTGSQNVAIGNFTGRSTTGGGNTYLGAQAGGSNGTGSNNVSIGRLSGKSQVFGDNNIAIGYDTSFANTGASDQLNIGNWIYGTNGNIGIGITTPTQKLDVAGSIRLTGNAIINNASPTTFYQDTDNRSAMIHVNGNNFHILRGDGNGSTSWQQFAGRWPLQIDLETNNATFGGTINARASTALANGVIGYSQDATAFGYLGHNNAYGVYGQGNQYGIVGRTMSGSFGGVLGYNHNATAYGIVGYGADISVLGNKKIVAGREGYFGTYDSTQVQGVWSIGGSYDIDGTATNDFGTQYGITYAHTNAGSGALGGKKPLPGQGHQLLFTQAGITKAMISLTTGDIQTSGNFIGNGSALTGLNAASITTGTIPDARLSTNVIMDTGTQTIAGVKTFSSSPIVPTPTAASHAATKGYVDNTFVSIFHSTGETGFALTDGWDGAEAYWKVDSTCTLGEFKIVETFMSEPTRVGLCGCSRRGTTLANLAKGWYCISG